MTELLGNSVREVVMKRFCILLCLLIFACAKASVVASNSDAEQAIRYKILSSWIIPNLPRINDPVAMEISLNRDGTVKNVKPVDQKKYDSDKNYKLLADSASNAIYKASPFEGLPTYEYDEWQVTYITFNLY